MKKVALAVLLAAMPLAAQSWELGAFVGQQSYKSVTILGLTGKPKSNAVLGARLGYSVVDLGPALVQFNVAFQPKTGTEFLPVAGINTSAQYDHQYMSVGAMFNLKAIVAFGVGLDYRMEKMNLTNTSGISDVSYPRPWLRATAGYAIPSPVVKPFIGLEVGVPLISKSFVITDNQQDLYRALAPKLQIGVYGGVRF